MTKEDRQEALSWAYVLAVAAVCGLTHRRPSKDYGIDLSLHEVLEEGGRYEESGTQLDVQLKSTTAAVVSAAAVGYDLDIRAYDALRTPTRTPRLLCLLVLPPDEDDWLKVTVETMELRGAAYWLDLRGQPDVPNRRSVRVTIPRDQLFTPDRVTAIMERLRTKRRRK